MSIDKLLTAPEVADLLSVKLSTVRKLTYQHALPGVVRPTGKRAVRYRLRELEALLRARTQPMRDGDS
jgi:excisionase family DNA binding protein